MTGRPHTSTISVTEQTNSLSCPTIPELYGLVKGSTSYYPGVWREEDLVNQCLVAHHSFQWLLVFCWSPKKQREII